jgi:hypothetical protein
MQGLDRIDVAQIRRGRPPPDQPEEYWQWACTFLLNPTGAELRRMS